MKIEESCQERFLSEALVAEFLEIFGLSSTSRESALKTEIENNQIY